jgi:broad specificity phosphatase PhoE
MPDTLIILRSGATDYEVQGRIRGTIDLPLAPAGIAEAEEAAGHLEPLRPVAVYTAAGRCAVETGRIVAAAVALRHRVVKDLTNLDHGLWQGLLVADIRDRQPRLYRQWQDNPWAIAPPEGELLEQACERVEAALERVVRRHASGAVALVVPAPLDRIVRWVAAGESMGDLWQVDEPRPLVHVLPLTGQWDAGSRRSTRPRGRTLRI